MSCKVKFLILGTILILSSPTSALDLTGSLDISGQYNTNFVEAGLYEEAQTLLTGEADSLAQIKLNLATERNFSENNYSKLDYTLETKGYSKSLALNSTDQTLGFQMDQRLAKETVVKIKASAKRHDEPSAIKKHLETTFLLKGIKEINPKLSFDLSFGYARKGMEDTAARDYFAYMNHLQTSLGGKFRYEFRKDFISKLSLNSSNKQYDHTASNYLKTVFATLNTSSRQDQSTLVNLDLTRVFHENFLTNLLLGYVSNPSNISYYQYTGTRLVASTLGYWKGNRWWMKYTFGNYDYPSRSGIGFTSEQLQSSQYSIKMRREVRTDVYLNLAWEAIRNSSNNPTNNFNNDSYTLGFLANL